MKNSKVNQVKKQMDKQLQNDYREIRDGSRQTMSRPIKEYLKAIVDTKNAKLVGVPTNVGGYPGRTAVRRYKQETDIVIGTSGFGYINLNTSTIEHITNTETLVSGPFNNSRNIGWTDGTYSGTGIPPLNTALPVGVNQSGWSQSNIDISEAIKGNVQWRTVGTTLEVFPESSFSRQNGRIILLEIPSHDALNFSGASNVQFSDLESFPTSRVLRGVQTGAQSEKIVLNWHPRALDEANYSNSFNDFNFKSISGINQSSSPLQMPLKELIIIFIGDPGTRFHSTITSMFELRGRGINDIKPRLVDSRGMDLVMNTFAHKVTDGYVGKPEHVYESYLASAWRIAKKSAGFINRHQKEIMEGAGKAMSLIGGFI